MKLMVKSGKRAGKAHIMIGRLLMGAANKYPFMAENCHMLVNGISLIFFPFPILPINFCHWASVTNHNVWTRGFYMQLCTYVCTAITCIILLYGDFWKGKEKGKVMYYSLITLIIIFNILPSFVSMTIFFTCQLYFYVYSFLFIWSERVK